jgi:hypothetical protein
VAWIRVADALGITTEVPILLLNLFKVIAAVLVAANLLAAAARAAARIRAGLFLRANNYGGQPSLQSEGLTEASMTTLMFLGLVVAIVVGCWLAPCQTTTRIPDATATRRKNRKGALTFRNMQR